MRKTLFTLAATILLGAFAGQTTAEAQTSKGNFFLSGASQISYTGTFAKDMDTQSVFTVAPSFGYFVMDNLSVGLSSSITYTSGAKTTMYAVMPTASYFFNNGGNFLPYVSLGVGYTGTSVGDTNMGGLGVGAGGGGMYMVNQNVGFNMGLQYTYTNMKVGELSVSGNSIAAQIGITVFF